jgi:hypothetical protein
MLVTWPQARASFVLSSRKQDLGSCQVSSLSATPRRWDCLYLPEGLFMAWGMVQISWWSLILMLVIYRWYVNKHQALIRQPEESSFQCGSSFIAEVGDEYRWVTLIKLQEQRVPQYQRLVRIPLVIIIRKSTTYCELTLVSVLSPLSVSESLNFKNRKTLVGINTCFIIMSSIRYRNITVVNI